jgi:hypothetical protein
MSYCYAEVLERIEILQPIIRNLIFINEHQHSATLKFLVLRNKNLEPFTGQPCRLARSFLADKSGRQFKREVLITCLDEIGERGLYVCDHFLGNGNIDPQQRGQSRGVTFQLLRASEHLL